MNLELIGTASLDMQINYFGFVLFGFCFVLLFRFVCVVWSKEVREKISIPIFIIMKNLGLHFQKNREINNLLSICSLAYIVGII